MLVSTTRVTPCLLPLLGECSCGVTAERVHHEGWSLQKWNQIRASPEFFHSISWMRIATVPGAVFTMVTSGLQALPVATGQTYTMVMNPSCKPNGATSSCSMMVLWFPSCRIESINSAASLADSCWCELCCKGGSHGPWCWIIEQEHSSSEQ